MQLKPYLFDDDRGVSPVIGVILMVAITVILAAVIATFVMNMGPNESQSPQTSWDITNETSYFNIEHDGGGAATTGELLVRVDGEDGTTEEPVADVGDEWTAGENASITNGSSSSGFDWGIDASDAVGSSPSAGSEFTARIDSVELVWESPDTDETQVLTTFDG